MVEKPTQYRSGDSIKIVGLAALNRTFKKIDEDIPKEVAQTHREFATYVARLAKSYAASRPRKTSSGHVERTITARGYANKAAIAATGRRGKRSKNTDIMVQEFGGTVPLYGHPTKRFVVRPRKKDGYFMFPAVKEARPRIESVYLPALQRTINRAEQR